MNPTDLPDLSKPKFSRSNRGKTNKPETNMFAKTKKFNEALRLAHALAEKSDEEKGNASKGIQGVVVVDMQMLCFFAI